MSTFPGQNLAVANLNASETQGRSRAEEASALFPVRQLLQIMPPRRRLPVIGVMGSGKAAHEDLAAPLGRLLASLPVHLLTGGGAGVMECVSRHFVEAEGREGLCLGVLPGVERDGTVQPPPNYPNPHVELAIATHLPVSGKEGMSASSRNHINILTSDAVVALPGSHGTASEVQLATRYGKPVLAFLGAEGGATIEGLNQEEGGGQRPPVARSIEEVEAWLRALPQLSLGSST